MIGTARSPEFRERSGRRKAVHNLIENGIDRLIVIGGDGSLSAARTCSVRSGRRWSPNCVEDGAIDQQTADRHPALMIAGMVGSIDNDMLGTDMTIGADSALHRIVEAIDSISSTAASHQRSFVVEVMGRQLRLPRPDERDRRRRRLRVHPGEPARRRAGRTTCAS